MFEMSLRVGPADIDELGHFNNVRYVQWVQDVAVAHSSSVGLDFAAYERIGAVFVLRRHEADYLRSLPEGTVVRARTWLQGLRTVQVERRMEFLADDKLVFASLTRWVFVELATARPRRIPPEVVKAFEGAFVAPASS